MDPVCAVDRPDARSRARPDGIVLSHGAGSDASLPLLVALAAAFAAQGIAALRCDLPFRQARATGPPSPATAARDQDGVRHALDVMRGTVPGRVFAGGHSYGGRMTSLVAAAEPSALAALLLCSYPLHPPGRPAELRTGHFPGVCAPTLFVHGAEDPFASPEELAQARTLIRAPSALLALDGGHDLGCARDPGRAGALAQRVVVAFRALVGG